MKSVYLEPGPGRRLHSLYKELVDFPPYGYRFLVPSSIIDSNEGMIHFIEREFLTRIKRLSLEYLSDYLTSFVSVCYSKIKDKESPKGAELTYSSQHLVFRKEPWVVDLEFATALVSYGRFGLTKSIVERVLASYYCKKIMPWTDMGKKTLLKCLDCRKFEDKIETVHLAVRPKNFVKKYDREKIRILFVGTGNPWNVAESFQLKGGREVLMAFKYLNQQYRNLELVIRSYVPENILAPYIKCRNINLINKMVTWEILSKIFETSDIFLFPTHSTPGMVILDAMSYELPVITTDLWANSEMVKDRETGFLIKKSKKIPYVRDHLIPNWGSRCFAKFIQNPDPEVIQQIVEKTSILIEDEKLRRCMGRTARREIETGKFSIKRRNEKLKKIFDGAIAC